MSMDKLIDSVRLDGALRATADKIRSKTGGSTPIPFDMDTGYASAVEEIQVGGGSGGAMPSAKPKDVNFYDYDGVLLYSYTLAEARALNALPDGPTHDGLTFQGWNWSLDKVKALTRAMNIGAMYTTSDGKTRIYIHLTEGRTSPMLGVCPNGTVDVDWGDGTAHDTLAGANELYTKYTPTHEYAEPGDYVITLTIDGMLGLKGSLMSCVLINSSNTNDYRNYAYQRSIQRVEIGNGVTIIGDYAFNECRGIRSITIPDSVTSIGVQAFAGCHNLSNVTIPDGVTSIVNKSFSNCRNLSNVTIPDSVTSIGNQAFASCLNLSRVTIPDSVTSIGASAFSSCYVLRCITIPDDVTCISNGTFNACYNLSSVTIPDGVTSIDGQAFYMCESLRSVTIPDSVTSIGNAAFSMCGLLNRVTIPDSVASIGEKAFSECRILSSITIPDSVTNIGSNAFQMCNGVRYYDFTKHTSVPTLAYANAIVGPPEDCEIRVPAELYDEWIAATNWSTLASYIVAV